MKLRNSLCLLTTLTVILVASLFTGCGVYSLSGISIDYDKIKTISIQQFYSDINQGPANIGQTFTNTLMDYYQQNTNLSLIKYEGDLQIEGGITGYRLQPIAAQQQQNDQSRAAQTRLTLTIQVTYYNTQDDTYNFENRSFSFFRDFNNSENLGSIENLLIDEIFEQVVMDIFNASVANW